MNRLPSGFFRKPARPEFGPSATCAPVAARTIIGGVRHFTHPPTQQIEAVMDADTARTIPRPAQWRRTNGPTNELSTRP